MLKNSYFKKQWNNTEGNSKKQWGFVNKTKQNNKSLKHEM